VFAARAKTVMTKSPIIVKDFHMESRREITSKRVNSQVLEQMATVFLKML
jgi:hypothetical protein